MFPRLLLSLLTLVITIDDVGAPNIGEWSVSVFDGEVGWYHHVAGSGTNGRHVKCYLRFWYAWCFYQQDILLRQFS